MARRFQFLNWQVAGLVGAALVVFFLTLFGLAHYVDNTALTREKRQLQSTVDVAITELARRITSISDWDDAVAHLDRSLDARWAQTNVGEYYLQNDALPLSFVLSSSDRAVLAMLNGRLASPDSYRPFAQAMKPLLAHVRAQERRRGPFRPPFHAFGEISQPIQAMGIARIGNAPYVVVATLVQPDMGRVLPRAVRAPILVNAEPLEGAFLQEIGARLLMPELRFLPRSSAPVASIAVRDVRGPIAGFLTWEPWTPGGDLILFAFLPILAGVAFPLALYLRSRAMAAKLAGALEELSQARDRVHAALKAAQESDNAKSKFLANMSHELRTPLNAIMGFSEMLKSEGFRDRTEDYADTIHRSASFLLTLINDILDLSKINAGKLELIEADIDVGAVIGSCLSMMRARAEESRLAMQSEIPPDLPKLRGDPRYLSQIILNLLSNATKFSDVGGRVCVHAFITGIGEMSLAVCDSGRGIRSEDQALVFEHFGRGRHDVVEKDKGMGLGLPIVRGLTEAHGGRVMLESALGKGTTVTVIFPKERGLPRTKAQRVA